ncbi:alpha/beta fold hydrolase [Bradyrhizobium diazoefficiens]|uniref:alpha/beta fold hydrolase n=1 Tax=Bradyrhizobium diazoefficiens TaxID=1355477 RepID=UPI0012FEA3B3|nr:alpha/beta hydrolase [Bradyrhizobium diazoefficiens]
MSSKVSSQLVFIHGFLDEGRLWSQVIGDLREVPSSNALALDLPGMGSRAKDGGDYGLSTLRDFVVKEVAGLAGPLVLVGHSMGTQIAELVATALPGRVTSLVLISPVPLGGLPVPDDVASAMRKLGGDGDAQRRMRSQLMADPSIDKIDAMVTAGLKVKAATVAALFDAFSQGVPEGKEPTKFKGTVLIIGGANDGFSTPELVKTVIAPRFPQAELAFTERAGHWPHVEQPNEIASRIDDFLAKRGS